VQTRREGTAAAMGEMEPVELFAKLGHGMAMVLAMGSICSCFRRASHAACTRTTIPPA